LWGFLHDVGTKAKLLAEGDGLLVGASSGGGGEEDEWLIAKCGGGELLLCGQRVIAGEDGDEGLGEDGFTF
jgi:hypothetical protein